MGIAAALSKVLVRVNRGDTLGLDRDGYEVVEVDWLKEIEILLMDSDIEPKEIRVPAHEPVRLLVINFDDTEHRFAVESSQCCIEIEDLKPGQTRAVEHVFSEPGSFKTTCYGDGPEKPEMNGWLFVDA